MKDGRVIPFFLEHGRRDLAAEIAIDAGAIDKKIARDVLGVSKLRIGHPYIRLQSMLSLKSCVGILVAAVTVAVAQEVPKSSILDSSRLLNDLKVLSSD